MPETITLGRDEDAKWQHSVLTLFDEVREVIFEVTASRAFLYSGTLLGYVRDKNFISYDKDMDCAYVSSQPTAELAVSEFINVARLFTERGYHVNVKASCVSIRRTHGTDEMVDIAMLFLKPDGSIGFPFGTVSDESVYPSTFLPIQTGKLGNHLVTVPQDPSGVVEIIYGRNWRIPDPDFSWRKERKRRDVEGLIPYRSRSKAAIDDFYKHFNPVHPSAFSRWVVAQPFFADVSGVIDVGCGNARDSRLLSRGGRQVVGVDRSKYAVSSARQLLELRESKIQVVHEDITRPAALPKLIDQVRRNDDESVLIYGRMLLGSMTSKEAERFIKNLKVSLRSGDRIAFEARSDLDQKRKKVFERSFRNYIDCGIFAKTLIRSGFQIEYANEGIGWAKYKNENPHVIRIVAKVAP